MSPVNPIFGLPASTVDRLTESDEKNRQKEGRRTKKETAEKNQKAKEEAAENAPEECESPSSLLSSQPLDSEKVVELLGQQVKPMIPTFKAFAPHGNATDNVKKLLDQKKVDRAI